MPTTESNPNKIIWDKLKKTDPRATKGMNKGWGNLLLLTLNGR